MRLYLLQKAANLLYSLATDEAPDKEAKDTIKAEPAPATELGSKINPIIITNPTNEKEKNIQRIQQEGKQIGKASWQLGNEFVLGNRYRKLSFTPTVVPYNKVDMRSPSAKEKIIEAIIELIQTDEYFSNLKDNPDLIKNFIANLMGMKTAEGSSANYNIGNIQVGNGKHGIPNKYWHDVFLMGDKNYSGGTTIPYIELWRSYDKIEDGVKDWIYFLKDLGMLSAALNSPKDFYTKLRSNMYFGKNLSKNPNAGHEKEYVGGIEYGRKTNKDLIDKIVEKYRQPETK